MALKAVFFDIDGTLVDSNDFHVMAWDEAIRDGGQSVEREAIRNQMSKGSDQMLPSLFPMMAKDQRERIAERHGEIFRTRYLQQVQAFPFATDLIELLYQQGRRVVLASSAKQAEVDHYISFLKIHDAISDTVSKDSVANSKPAGDIFASALGKVFPVAAAETFAIGDTPYDVLSALKSEIKTIAVRSGGFSVDDLVGSGAAFVYASVTELFELYAQSSLAQ